LKDKLHRLKPSIDATHGAGCSSEARTALLKVRALDAHAPMIRLLISKRQSIGDVVGIALAETAAPEQADTVDEPGDLARVQRYQGRIDLALVHAVRRARR
jgi:hypothetical protein